MRDIKKIISEMTLEEKAGMCSGEDFWHLKSVERLGVPQVMVSDGPHGLRKQAEGGDHLGMGESIKAVCFPAACATAASWDTDLLESLGKSLGNECQAEGVSVLLGPGINIKRSPLCGRNFEYFSEDPYLTGKLASAQIKGVQSQNIGTSLKHFAVNNQEYNRMSCSSNLSERALREIYLSAFEEAVKTAQPKTIMCSYNKINGVYASENKKLLTDILRDEWGFEGIVVTDWGAVSDRVKGLQAGLDLEMPGSGGTNDKKIIEAIKNGTLDEKVLDHTVERILEVIFSCEDHKQKDAYFDHDADHKKAVDYATECAVLLENNGVLPLDKDKKIVYIGEYATKPRFQGAGSSHINYSRFTSALDSAIRKGRNIEYTKGFPADKDLYDEEEAAVAIELAKNADVAVIFAGLPDSFESEGYDRKSMDIPACQNRLIHEVSSVQANTIVVLHNGSPIETPWVHEVAAVLEMYLGGQGVGEACDQLLFGEVNPSGRLPETFPLRLQDNPSYLFFPGDGKNVDYHEDIYVGYRYYEKKQVPVRWAFGYGLSYTSFIISNIETSAETMSDEGTILVNVDVTNTGNIAGKEVVQLYIADKNGTPNRAVKELRGFKKVALLPGETKTLTMEIGARDLSYYSEEIRDWYAPSGTYEILIGQSSNCIVQNKEITYTTSKQLPFVIDGSTTLGELMNDQRTAPMVEQILAQSLGGMKQTDSKDELGDSLGGGQELIEAMMSAMPLKSIVVFAGGAVELDTLISMFQSVLE